MDSYAFNLQHVSPRKGSRLPVSRPRRRAAAAAVPVDERARLHELPLAHVHLGARSHAGTRGGVSGTPEVFQGRATNSILPETPFSNLLVKRDSRFASSFKLLRVRSVRTTAIPREKRTGPT